MFDKLKRFSYYLSNEIHGYLYSILQNENTNAVFFIDIRFK